MTTRRDRRAALAVLAMATAMISLAGGCGKQLNVTRAQDAISREVQRVYQVKVVAVTCPNDVHAKKGSTFTCLVVLSGDRLSVDVTQRDDKGDITFRPAQAIVSLPNVVKAIRTQYNATSVDCGTATVWVSRAGRTFDCQARDRSGGKGTITVTITDTKGNIQLDFAK